MKELETLIDEKVRVMGISRETLLSTAGNDNVTAKWIRDIGDQILAKNRTLPGVTTTTLSANQHPKPFTLEQAREGIRRLQDKLIAEEAPSAKLLRDAMMVAGIDLDAG